jgi:hypothetical protein
MGRQTGRWLSHTTTQIVNIDKKKPQIKSVVEGLEEQRRAVGGVTDRAKSNLLVKGLMYLVLCVLFVFIGWSKDLNFFQFAYDE